MTVHGDLKAVFHLHVASLGSEIAFLYNMSSIILLILLKEYFIQHNYCLKKLLPFLRILCKRTKFL